MNEDQAKLLDDLLECEDAGFTGWEIDFLDSLDKQRDRPLTDKQAAVLERISKKAQLID